MSAPLPQRVCGSCRELTPRGAPACAACGEPFRSALRWKVPLIALLFVLALAVSLAIELR